MPNDCYRNRHPTAALGRTETFVHIADTALIGIALEDKMPVSNCGYPIEAGFLSPYFRFSRSSGSTKSG